MLDISNLERGGKAWREVASTTFPNQKITDGAPAIFSPETIG